MSGLEIRIILLSTTRQQPGRHRRTSQSNNISGRKWGRRSWVEPQGGGRRGVVVVMGATDFRRYYWSTTRLRMSLSSQKEINYSHVETFVRSRYQERKPRVSFSLPLYKSFPIKVSFVTNTSRLQSVPG